jgi:hypothetical protein
LSSMAKVSFHPGLLPLKDYPLMVLPRVHLRHIR